MKKKYFIQLILFLTGIIFVSYSYWIGSFSVLFMILLFSLFEKETRLFSLNILAFLVGFILYQYSNFELKYFFANNYSRILVNRCLLIIIILCCLIVSFIYNRPVFKSFNKPLWNNRIYFPYISRGRCSIRVSYFLVQAVLINMFIFTPFVLIHRPCFTSSLILFTILFSLLNAIFEEVIWRGLLLNIFRDNLNNTIYAVIFTSIGFGLQHISLGFSLLPSILFSFGGIWFAIVDLRTDSIYPSIIWHIIINIGMVLSGVIF